MLNSNTFYMRRRISYLSLKSITEHPRNIISTWSMLSVVSLVMCIIYVSASHILYEA
jgi:hypothetical protein